MDSNTGDHHHQPSHLMLLNDDCLEIIYDHLPIAAVMKLAETCTRLEAFATQYILRQIIKNHNYKPKLSESFLCRLLSQNRHRIDVICINGGLEGDSKIFQLTVGIDGKFKRTISAHHFLGHCKWQDEDIFSESVELQKSVNKLIQQSLSMASENSRTKNGRLRSIKLVNCSQVTAFSLFSRLSVAHNLKYIRELKVVNCPQICDQMLFEKIVKNLPQLESIALNWPIHELLQVKRGLRQMSKLRCVELCGDYTPPRVRALMRVLSDVPTLDELQLNYEFGSYMYEDCSTANDESSIIFARLKKLTINQRHQLDEIRSIVRQMPSIERLDVNCSANNLYSNCLRNIVLVAPTIRTIHFKCNSNNVSIRLLLQVLLKQSIHNAARATLRLHTYAHSDMVDELKPLLKANRHLLLLTNVTPCVRRQEPERRTFANDTCGEILIIVLLILILVFIYIILRLMKMRNCE